jgi:hypothetical protein
MAFQSQQTLIPGLKAGADLSAADKQYKFVKLSAKGTVVLCTAITDKVVGVLQNRPASGEGADVCAIGLTKLQGDADLAVGVYVGPSTDSQAQVAVATQFPCGQIIEDNGAAGGYCTALVNCAGATVVA